MNRIETVVVALSVLVVFSGAGAQSPPPGASAPETSSTAAPKGTEAPSRANRDVSTSADARRCLEFATNPEIIKCAEKYLQRRRNG